MALGVGIVERALGEHQLGAAALAGGRPLLGGLEDEEDGAGELVADGGQGGGEAEADGGVDVVAAGVGDADLAAFELAAPGGGVRQVGLLDDGQGVHVGADGDHGAVGRTGGAAAQDADDAGVGDAGADFVEAEGAQVGGDEGGGLGLAVGELGVGVDPVAQVGGLGGGGGEGGGEAWGEGVLRDGRWRGLLSTGRWLGGEGVLRDGRWRGLLSTGRWLEGEDECGGGERREQPETNGHGKTSLGCR